MLSDFILSHAQLLGVVFVPLDVDLDVILQGLGDGFLLAHFFEEVGAIGGQEGFLEHVSGVLKASALLFDLVVDHLLQVRSLNLSVRVQLDHTLVEVLQAGNGTTQLLLKLRNAAALLDVLSPFKVQLTLKLVKLNGAHLATFEFEVFVLVFEIN